MSRPNILFILSDQHNAKALGHQGHPDVLTPHLDRMAAEGVRFDASIAQNPICTPSRMCFHSGQYCHNHGYYGLDGRRPHGLPTLYGHFRRAGYATAAIGKIHCPEYWLEDDCDAFLGTCNPRSAAYSAFLEERGKADIEDHGRMAEFGRRGRQSMDARPSPLAFEESQEGWIADQAIGFMRASEEAGKPFLVHASPPRPHQCTAPSEPFWSLYAGKELSFPPNADWGLEGRSPQLRKRAEGWRRGDWALLEPRTFEAARRRKLHGYLAAISQTDHAVGRMLDFLLREGLAENTIVVYSADHGEYACEHGIMEKAPGIAGDAVTRIPLLWWGPGRFKPGHVAREVVESVDVSTTLCALAGLEPMATSDGHDLSPMLRGEPGDAARVGVTECPWSKSIRKGTYRLVRYPRPMFAEEYPGGFGELYDLATDPWEMRNLYFDPAHTATVAELQRDLMDWLIATTRVVTLLPKVSLDGCQTFTRHGNSYELDGKLHPRHVDRTRHANYL